MLIDSIIVFQQIVNNRLSPDAVSNWFKKSPNYTEQLQQSVNEILEECKNVEDPDRYF